jgi:hypothetical protein
MKKIISLWGVVLLIISMTLVGYAKMEKTAISKGNLAGLKGEWVGTRTIGPGRDLNTDLEILNDTLPVHTKFILYDVEKKGRQRGETLTTEFKSGKINDQGNLLVTGNNIEVELSLFEDDGKKKLEGNFFWKGTKGTMSFKKK